MKKFGLIALFGVALMTHVYAGAPAANIRLKPNQQMVDVTLAANPTTGYQWFVQNYDHDLLSLQNYRYIANNKTSKMGVGGVAIFSFAVDPRFYDAPQVTNISFVYQQPWNPGQNATVAEVTISAVASSNDLSNWQKYPQLAGPAAEVQASEASIYAQDQGESQPAAPPVPMVTLPGTTNAPAKAVPQAKNAANTEMGTSAALTAPSVAAVKAPPVVTTTSTGNQIAPTPVLINTNAQVNNSSATANDDQVMPAGEPTPDTDSQNQWLSLPPGTTQATTASQATAVSAASTGGSNTATTNVNANK